MSKLRFTDGIEIETNCEPRILSLHDGLYVVGNGRLSPVKDQAEAEAELTQMKKIECPGCYHKIDPEDVDENGMCAVCNGAEEDNQP